MRKVLILLACVISVGAWGQVPEFEWAVQMGGINNESGRAITTDQSGNVYVTGDFSGVADFDPGSDTFNLISILDKDGYFSPDIFVAKYNSGGQLLWAVSYGSSGSDWGYGIDTDQDGNVYITGAYSNVAIVIKLDTNGSLVWEKYLGTGGMSFQQSWARSIVVDDNGNVYTTGRAADNTDFDPGPEDYILTTNTNSSNIFISKLNSEGNFVWAKAVGGEDEEHSYAITLDDIDNVYVTGIFQEGVDFDPSSEEYNLTAIGNGDLFVLKLTSNGDLLWIKHIGGEFGTIWGFDLVVDDIGNIYTTGVYNHSIDFDPGTSEFELPGDEEKRFFILKLNSSGDFIWVHSIGEDKSDFGNGIVLDNYNNVYVTGYFRDTVDFDPGLDLYTLSAINTDPFVLKLDKDGDFIWAGSFEGDEEDFFRAGVGEAIVLDRWNNIYTTGHFRDTTDFNPDTTVYNLLTNGGIDIFIHKMRQSCSYVPTIKSSTNNLTVCDKDSLLLFIEIPPYVTDVAYNWNTGDTLASILTSPDTSASYTISLTYTDSDSVCSFTDSIDIIVLPVPDTTFLDFTTCDSLEIGTVEFVFPAGNGCDSIVIESTTLIPLPEPPVPPNDTVITENAAPYQIMVTAVLNATEYSWQVPVGMQILSGQGTASITVDWPGLTTGGSVCVSAVNECGSSTLACMEVIVDITDPTDEVLAASYKVFPNPSSSQLNIIFSDQQQYEIRLFNTIGQQVKHYGDVRENVSLSVGHLPSGLYWLLIDCTSCTDKRSVLYKETVEILR